MYTYTEKELFSDSESDDIELGKMYKLSCIIFYTAYLLQISPSKVLSLLLHASLMLISSRK